MTGEPSRRDSLVLHRAAAALRAGVMLPAEAAEPLAQLLDELAPLAPYWAELYARPFVPIIAKGLTVAHKIVATTP